MADLYTVIEHKDSLDGLTIAYVGDGNNVCNSFVAASSILGFNLMIATPAGYEQTVRDQAIRLYVEGMNLRRIGRILGVNHQSVANWVNAYADRLPAAPVPENVETVELDELFTFVGDKKTQPTS